MSERILVIPHNESLLDQLRGESVVLHVNEVRDLAKAIHDTKRFQVHVHCFLLETNAPVTSIALDERWGDEPIALYSPRLGPFQDLVKQLPALRDFNIRIYLPADFDENYTSLRILSSLGVATAITFNTQPPKWEPLADLMTYALLGLAPHAAIEPFNYLASEYKVDQRTQIGSVYFNDPTKFLHVDNEGRIALCREHLAEGKFIQLDINGWGEIDQCAEYVQFLGNWVEPFLSPSGCAYCPAWRICLGEALIQVDENLGCRQYYSELMDVIEQLQSLKKRERVLWQPSS